ncbi:MAG: hypothetical protein ABJ246_07620 [Paracoccaceae bacterium]
MDLFCRLMARELPVRLSKVWVAPDGAAVVIMGAGDYFDRAIPFVLHAQLSHTRPQFYVGIQRIWCAGDEVTATTESVPN